ncbi:MAG: beta-N-acetylhexosaminidase, partial [Candidatus Aquilonibacter sp.]
MTSTTLDLACGVIVTGFSKRPTRPFAGYILFSRNLEDAEGARALTDALRVDAEPAPIVAIDQEGGRIMRLRNGVEPLPAMMALGAVADVGLAEDAGATLAHDLRRIGCTLDFAPVLDLALDARNTVIGTRAIGTSTELVTRIGGALARGLERGGITATFKHFPGHGATAFDTHLGGARLDADEATLRGRDLVPFRACARDEAAIMVAHVAVPAIDGDRPASLSRRFLTSLLRDEWHFGGVSFTDCMQMDAIAKSVGTVRGVVEAIAAGADCALVSHDPDLAFEAAQHLAQAVERGEVPLERLV